MTDQPGYPRRRAAASGCASLFFASVSPAMAYVDPGTGSMLVQMAIAGIAGAMFYFRQLRMAAAAWFRRVVLRKAAAEGAYAPDRSGDADSDR
jgi:hypothetical protein